VNPPQKREKRSKQHANLTAGRACANTHREEHIYRNVPNLLKRREGGAHELKKGDGGGVSPSQH